MAKSAHHHDGRVKFVELATTPDSGSRAAGPRRESGRVTWPDGNGGRGGEPWHLPLRLAAQRRGAQKDAAVLGLRAAFETLARLPISHIFPMGYACCLPEVVRDAREAYGYGEARPRILPTPQQIADMDRVLDWLFTLDAGDRKILAEIGCGDSYRAIGRRHAFSHEWIRRLAEPLLLRLAAHLDGPLDAGS